jgi:hypothetical protein
LKITFPPSYLSIEKAVGDRRSSLSFLSATVGAMTVGGMDDAHSRATFK